jgi:hypothetical protein
LPARGVIELQAQPAQPSDDLTVVPSVESTAAQSAGQRAVGGIGGAAFHFREGQLGDRQTSLTGLRVDVTDQQLAELLARLNAEGFAPLGAAVAGGKDAALREHIEPTAGNRRPGGTRKAALDSETHVTRVRVAGSIDQMRGVLERWGFRAEEVPAAETDRYLAADESTSASVTEEKSPAAPAQAESFAVPPRPAAKSIDKPTAGVRAESDVAAADTELADSKQSPGATAGIWLFFRHVDSPRTAAPTADQAR